MCGVCLRQPQYKRSNQKTCGVNIMWIMIILLMILNAVYAFGLLEALSDADDQSERLKMEQGRDGRNG